MAINFMKFNNTKRTYFPNAINFALLIIFCSVFISCGEDHSSIVKVENSDNQWPMSGGPDGSWKIKTSSKVPTKWSVRTGENIKWKKALPAGGQSGIAVWGKKIFFTINPPLDTPSFSELQNQHNKAKNAYDTYYDVVLNDLKKERDPAFQKTLNTYSTANKKWTAFLEKDENYQNASKENKKGIANKLKRENELGKNLSATAQSLVDFVHSTSDKLIEYHNKLNETSDALKTRAYGADIILYCMNADNGETLWTKRIKGELPSEYNYGFSDSTSPCPITDGEHVWAINASGGMACFSMDGDLIWERTWMPTVGRPFNKQFDSALYDDLILNVEPPEKNDSTRIQEWNYLHAFDKNSGKRLWVTEEAITHYNTPILGETIDKKPAILIGRGGPHGVPERPVGLSLIGLEGEKAGVALWNWESKVPNEISGYGALNTQHWDKHKISWTNKGEDNVVIDSNTGELIGQNPLNFVNQYIYDEQTKQHVLKENVELKNLENEFHCNMSVNDHTFYMVMHQPFVARHNIETGKNEHLELPREINPDGSFIWKTPQKNDGLNSRGQLHSTDSRILGDGFQRSFLGSPTMINDYLFFTNALGIVYVIDTTTENFDETAIVAINDLGEKGKTWTVNSLSFANGNIYHRTLKEIICIGK
ncbi:PQQ-binding-like beta-propeller repeat protein [Flagellimonas pacifica]|uniref:PQQ-like domain-containing protein n=1 Tax=Flagellimonas pacifica TaxID=1247520 RepID=A0A285MVC7_9FLAO|nr:PQQ-binding-like beta-propeller repeat protein [Allomuricauda parva]SNZ01068.1 PQQ-like domain-containing protein [Allomuricauda parva]